VRDVSVLNPTTTNNCVYCCKYICKGSDRSSFSVEIDSGSKGNGGGQVAFTPRDEIAEFQSARYIGPHEAFWHIYGFSMYDCSHMFERLKVHRLGLHSVTFTVEGDPVALDTLDDDMDDPIDPDDTMSQGPEGPPRKRGLKMEPSEVTLLTSYYATVVAEANKEGEGLVALKHAFGPPATQLSYVQFPEFYSWNNHNKEWRRRTRRTYDRTVVRVHAVPVLDRELWYLRLLLCNVKGVQSEQHLMESLKFHGRRCVSFHEAAKARGLAEDDLEWFHCLKEASREEGRTASSLRSLYCLIFAYCSPSDPVQLFHDFQDDLSDDFTYRRCNRQIGTAQSIDHYRALLAIYERLEVDLTQSPQRLASLKSLIDRWNPDDRASLEQGSSTSVQVVVPYCSVCMTFFVH
jgi:hypothetical protein